MKTYSKDIVLITKDGTEITITDTSVPALIHSHKISTFEFSESGGTISLQLGLSSSESV